MMDDSAEIFLQSFLQEAIVSSSGLGRDVHSETLSVQHFLCQPRHHPPSKVPWMVLESLSSVRDGQIKQDLVKQHYQLRKQVHVVQISCHLRLLWTWDMDPACRLWKKGLRLSRPNASGNVSTSPTWSTHSNVLGKKKKKKNNFKKEGPLIKVSWKWRALLGVCYAYRQGKGVEEATLTILNLIHTSQKRKIPCKNSVCWLFIHIQYLRPHLLLKNSALIQFLVADRAQKTD